jgi:hypothetical protein
MIAKVAIFQPQNTLSFEIAAYFYISAPLKRALS